MKRRVLVVDDSAVARMLIREMIDASRFDVTEAMDGIEALRAIRSESFDVVLLDLLMPNMTGVEILQRLLEMKDAPRIVVLSSDGQEQTVKRCLSLGAATYLHKPVRPHHIAAALGEAEHAVF